MSKSTGAQGSRGAVRAARAVATAEVTGGGVPPRRSRRHDLGSLLLIAGLTVLPFLPALGGGFVNFDDDRAILRNPYLRQPFADAWRWAWTTTFIGHYQPLTWLSLWIDGAIGGFRPFAFHLTSLALHAIAAALLAATLVRLLRLAPATRDASTPAVWVASAAAALFWSIHPLRVESVAWIAERRDPLSAIFWLLALYAWLRSVAPAEARRRAWYGVSVAALAVSLLAKSWGMSFVIVLLAIDWAVLGRRAWLEKVPYAVLGAAAAVVAWLAQHGATATMVPIARWGWGARALQACYGLCFYVWKTVLPTRLAALYELPRDWQEMASAFSMAALIAGSAAIAIVYLARRHRAIGAAAIVYALTLAPVLGFAQSGPQLVADRYAYISSFAIAALVAAALVFLARRTGLRLLAGACAAVLFAYGNLTVQQSRVWHDSETLWRHAIEAGEGGYRAHLDLGQALRADGRLDEALDQYRIALARRPDAGNGWYIYGNAIKAKGDLGAAEIAFRRATIYADPGSVEWLLAHVNLGNMYYGARRLDAAIVEYRAAVSRLAGRPATEVPPEPYLYLGMALGDKGDLAGAREALAVAARFPATRARAEAELRRLAR